MVNHLNNAYVTKVPFYFFRPLQIDSMVNGFHCLTNQGEDKIKLEPKRSGGSLIARQLYALLLSLFYCVS